MKNSRKSKKISSRKPRRKASRKPRRKASRKPRRKASRKPRRKASRKHKFKVGKISLPPMSKKELSEKFKLNLCVTKCEKCSDIANDWSKAQCRKFPDNTWNAYDSKKECEVELKKGWKETSPTAKTKLIWKYTKFKTALTQINEFKVPWMTEYDSDTFDKRVKIERVDINEVTKLIASVTRMRLVPTGLFDHGDNTDLRTLKELKMKLLWIYNIWMHHVDNKNNTSSYRYRDKHPPPQLQPLKKRFLNSYGVELTETYIGAERKLLSKALGLRRLLDTSIIPCLNLKTLFGRLVPNLSFLDLSRAQFPEADFSWDTYGEEVNIMYSKLLGANLRGADLKEVNFTCSDLRSADLRSADLRGADLSNTRLIKANLQDAKLQGAVLRSANLRNANLQDARLINADLRGAKLFHANLRNANLRRADLRNAKLQDADLQGADLQGADLRGADLSGADLRGAKFGHDTPTIDENTLIKLTQFRLNKGQSFPIQWLYDFFGGRKFRVKNPEDELEEVMREKGAIIKPGKFS